METHDAIAWLGLLLAFLCALTIPAMLYEWLFLPSRRWIKRLRQLERGRAAQRSAQ